MIILGHKDIESEKIFLVDKISDISETPANSTIFLKSFNIEILKFAKKNSVSVAIEIQNISEAILSENLDVKYIISEIKLASQIQKIADNYMYDSKILTWIEKDGELEKVAELQIDGVIFREWIET